MLGRHRSNVDYEPVPDNVENLRLMRLMAEEDRRHPFLGSRRMVLWLATQQAAVNRKRVPRWPQNRGIQGIAPGPKTTVRATATRSIRTCCGVWSSPVRTKSGPAISPTFRCHGVTRTGRR